MHAAIFASLILTAAGSTSTALVAETLEPAPAIVPVNAQEPREFSDVRELLEALETADQGIERLGADIIYRRLFALAGDTQVRDGSFAYERTEAEDGTPDRRFRIDFERLYVGDKLDEGYSKTYIFDGEWLAEIEGRQFNRRQVVPPGEKFDPLAIGEGPFPWPVGQRADDILERFAAELRPSPEGLEDQPDMRAVAQAKSLTQLLLVPRADSDMADEFEEIRLWYDATTEALLPRLARTVAIDGDESYILLTNVAENGEAFDGGVFDTRPPQEPGWNVHISPFRAD